MISRLPIPLLLVVSIQINVSLSCSKGYGDSKLTPTHTTEIEDEQKPDWLKKIPRNHSVGTFSYSFHNLDKAKEFAIIKAIDKFIIAMDAEREVVESDLSISEKLVLGKEEYYTTTSTGKIKTIIVPGQKININYEVVEYWINEKFKEVSVLIKANF